MAHSPARSGARCEREGLTMKITTVEQMRSMDRRAIEEFGIPEPILMENAGVAASGVIFNEVDVVDLPVVVVCGLGNNGGDGFVVARKLASYGARVEVLLLGDSSRLKGAAAQNLELLRQASIALRCDASVEDVVEVLGRVELVVDGLLGTGLTRDVGGRYRGGVEAINDSGLPVYSLDIPSGVDGDTGEIRGVAIDADATITFGLPKLGNVLYPGAARNGRLFVTHISFPRALVESDELQCALNTPPPLPPRRPDGHKGTFGDVLTIAGASSYFGAPTFAALSVLAAGAGYSRLAAPRSLVAHLANRAPEVVYLPQPETASGSLSLEAKEELVAASKIVDFVILGPGLSLDEASQRLARELARRIEKPLLIDGDGLSAMVGQLDVIRGRTEVTVLTPHPGEMARLSGCSVAELQREALRLVRELARDLGAIIVYKTARTLIGLPSGQVTINTSGNCGMGTAGAGDVLTGTIAAMYGLGLGVEEAVRAGVFVHGVAGDLAAHELGQDGVKASDILAHLPLAMRAYREAFEELLENSYATVEVVA